MAVEAAGDRRTPTPPRADRRLRLHCEGSPGCRGRSGCQTDDLRRGGAPDLEPAGPYWGEVRGARRACARRDPACACARARAYAYRIRVGFGIAAPGAAEAGD